MLAKRIIPCLDVKDGRTVKGTRFVELRDAGDPVELAAIYRDQGADELVFLDITATVERRSTFVELVRRVGAEIDIPFTVGGGINSIGDISTLLASGADRVSINSGAIRDPSLLNAAGREFGEQCIVLAIDAKRVGEGWRVFSHGGRLDTGIDALKWAKRGAESGAGEILLTSIDADGTKGGFEIALTRAVSKAVSVPVIASGGAGDMPHFADVFLNANADAALAASIFHYGEIKIPELKSCLGKNGVTIRI